MGRKCQRYGQRQGVRKRFVTTRARSRVGAECSDRAGYGHHHTSSQVGTITFRAIRYVRCRATRRHFLNSNRDPGGETETKSLRASGLIPRSGQTRLSSTPTAALKWRPCEYRPTGRARHAKVAVYALRLAYRPVMRKPVSSHCPLVRQASRKRRTRGGSSAPDVTKLPGSERY
jgi:hypothetical protein